MLCVSIKWPLDNPAVPHEGEIVIQISKDSGKLVFKEGADILGMSPYVAKAFVEMLCWRCFEAGYHAADPTLNATDVDLTAFQSALKRLEEMTDGAVKKSTETFVSLKKASEIAST
ncbi:MAG: hypothetical protein B7Z37_23475 [Verrucomicrobia bacterium 12-59-8]|nr:MAG: hypothetical protein B7Z37_23475 [Verrucomicrobia bacterium 12-59-8]